MYILYKSFRTKCINGYGFITLSSLDRQGGDRTIKLPSTSTTSPTTRSSRGGIRPPHSVSPAQLRVASLPSSSQWQIYFKTAYCTALCPCLALYMYLWYLSRTFLSLTRVVLTYDTVKRQCPMSISFCFQSAALSSRAGQTNFNSQVGVARYRQRVSLSQ